MLEKTLESPLDCKETQPVHSEGDQPWDFFGRNDAKAETPVLWPPYAKSWLIGKDSDAGRDWGQEEKGMTEDEMAGWHHWLDGCVSVNSGSWWWTGRPGVLGFMGSQRVGHDWVTNLIWSDLMTQDKVHHGVHPWHMEGTRGLQSYEALSGWWMAPFKRLREPPWFHFYLFCRLLRRECWDLQV